jgi:hypothetical protein
VEQQEAPEVAAAVLRVPSAALMQEVLAEFSAAEAVQAEALELALQAALVVMAEAVEGRVV